MLSAPRRWSAASTSSAISRLTTSLVDAADLVRRVRASGRVFCLTHNYTAYPMVRQARDMVRAGDVGEVRQIHASYVQGHNATLVEGDGGGWRFDPAQGRGRCLPIGPSSQCPSSPICECPRVRARRCLPGPRLRCGARSVSPSDMDLPWLRLPMTPALNVSITTTTCPSFKRATATVLSSMGLRPCGGA